MSTTTATAQEKVVSRLNAQMGSDLPTPVVTVYSYHAVANLVLDAITVEPQTNIPVTSDSGYGDGQFIENHEIRISIRIHTSYSGGIEQLDRTLELVDEVITAIKSSYEFAGDKPTYKLMGFANEGINIEFAESQSVGAELIAIIHKLEGYP
jgi:hypothetical protein